MPKADQEAQQTKSDWTSECVLLSREKNAGTDQGAERRCEGRQAQIYGD